MIGKLHRLNKFLLVFFYMGLCLLQSWLGGHGFEEIEDKTHENVFLGVFTSVFSKT